jgi:dTDP-glucose 4,6-dehydratase
MVKQLLMTGSTGFCGKAFAETVSEKTDWLVVRLNREFWDFREPWPHPVPQANYFVHFAANVRARESIERPRDFIAANILGTFHALELAREVRPDLFVYISSAEALGGCEEGYLHEGAALRPSNPYAATKGAGELLTYSYFRSYGLPAIIVRTMCVWSMDQSDPTKYVPMVKAALLKGEPVKIHMKDGRAGSRQWIEVSEFSNKLLELLPRAVPGETYHIVGEERDNIQQAQIVADRLGVPLEYEAVEMPATHAFRYAMVSTK